MRNNRNNDVLNVDREGEVIPQAFPISGRAKKDQSKTSILYTVLAVILHILAFVPIIAVSVVLAVKCYELTPYYTFWPFVGVIIVALFGIIYLVVALTVTRKKSKSSIGGQTAKVLVTFVCLTSVFALLLTYVFPDVIAYATQSTLFAEDLYYNGDKQAETNAKLDRDFIMYNLLNGNLNDYSKTEGGDYSYKTLSKRDELTSGGVNNYENARINKIYQGYYTKYAENASNAIDNVKVKILDPMKKERPRKYELYEFIYNTYVLNDFDYAMLNNAQRRLFALTIVDYIYENVDYEGLLKEGFSNKKIKQLFDDNYDNFNLDGYKPFDDPLLLYAQVPSRMTVPVVLRLILNEGWQHSQPVLDENNQIRYTEDNGYLYEMYDLEAKEEFVKNGGVFEYEGKLMNVQGEEVTVKYGYNEKGEMVFENGVVKRPIQWLVLDMLGSPMDVAKVNINSTLAGLLEGVEIGNLVIDESTISIAIPMLLDMLGGVIDSVGGVLQEDVAELIRFATDGANLNVCLCIDDSDQLSISIMPMNAQYGMLGYMQATWVQSNNLLMAVINVMGLRNWLCIFGAVGAVLVVAAGVLRECAKKTRERTAVSRDRIVRAQNTERFINGELTPEPQNDNSFVTDAAPATAADGAPAEEQADGKKKKPKRGKKSENPTQDEVAVQNADVRETADDLNLFDSAEPIETAEAAAAGEAAAQAEQANEQTPEAENEAAENKKKGKKDKKKRGKNDKDDAAADVQPEAVSEAEADVQAEAVPESGVNFEPAAEAAAEPQATAEPAESKGKGKKNKNKFGKRAKEEEQTVEAEVIEEPSMAPETNFSEDSDILEAEILNDGKKSKRKDKHADESEPEVVVQAEAAASREEFYGIAGVDNDYGETISAEFEPKDNKKKKKDKKGGDEPPTYTPPEGGLNGDIE